MTSSTVSREISGTNFTPTRAITYTYIYMVCETHFSSAVPGYVMWKELSVDISKT